MKKKIFTLIAFVALAYGINIQAQTSWNVAPDALPLNEFIAANYNEEGLSTYVLQRGGYYVLSGAISISGGLAIVAEEGDGARPVIIMGTNEEGGSNSWGMLWPDGDLIFESLNLKMTNDLGARGVWNNCFFMGSGSEVNYDIDDCIFEYSDGATIWSESAAAVTLKLTNNIFRWDGIGSGGRWHAFTCMLKNGFLEMALIENNTFVENMSNLFAHGNGFAKNVFINHNTIVSNGERPFGYEFAARTIFMNNLIVDGHFGGECPQDIAGEDTDNLPGGIYSIDYYRVGDTIKPTGYPAEEDRIILFSYNANYVTPEIKAHWESQPDTFLVADYSKGDNGFLNDRAYNMMKSEGDFNYPYFLWDDDLSMFVDDPGFTGYTVKTAEEIEISKQLNGYEANIPSENGSWGRYPEAEGDASWPLSKEYYDFSYTNAEYKKAGYAGYPLGDLNWWPEKKAEWENDPSRESYDDLIASIQDGTFEFTDYGITGIPRISETEAFKAYPNPVFDILFIEGAENKMKTLYSISGQEILISRENQMNVSGLQSGIYILRIDDQYMKIILK